jgi:ketosteroid isomerase-like protein
MKTLYATIAIVHFVIAALAQQNVETEIRNLEHRMDQAILAGDIETLKTIWVFDFTVNSPFNNIVLNRDTVFSRISTGVINYSSLTKNIEKVLIKKDMIITMGQEDLVHKETNQHIKRRFTNIWLKQDDGTWKMAARHANIMCN